MELIIVTGLSGAGKSRTVNALEDIGFFCVDNMPPKLISKFVEIGMQSKGEIERMAVVTDIRGGELFDGLFEELDLLRSKEFEYKLLFLTASDEVLIRRYKETRRKHPLVGTLCNSLEEAVKQERKIMSHARERADYILDTSLMSNAQLKERICKLFLDNIATGMMINCMSFGFKYGDPTYADLVFDVRCLPNPFYVDELKHKTGLNTEVKDYVMQSQDSTVLFDKIKDLIDFLLPLYLNEGKSQLTVAFGCTGGKHRSVTFAELLYQYLTDKGNKTSVNHRDINKL
ncbi:hypothetical protein CLOSTMETH_02834 [[Clostridium] methylpentosum DSM 5476]|jgi:RNase adapter protein RapZ|uniref:Uncharacterized protein n=1 Tax=[Clostridium] methylpentosum DSM 5476 TaxID=537013 RepID=C0EG42_9FIRM|nr:hypothetical protein CLOSTMETH_02834 [[Clostridium] methylpentosum DSM 5476]MDY3988221.1 RNase adapter RapZ [Massilioclostridium sp.]MEE1491344.1 RNase adapter RapZ [Massilioclostridium sp.]